MGIMLKSLSQSLKGGNGSVLTGCTITAGRGDLNLGTFDCTVSSSTCDVSVSKPVKCNQQ